MIIGAIALIILGLVLLIVLSKTKLKLNSLVVTTVKLTNSEINVINALISKHLRLSTVDKFYVGKIRGELLFGYCGPLIHANNMGSYDEQTIILGNEICLLVCLGHTWSLESSEGIKELKTGLIFDSAITIKI